MKQSKSSRPPTSSLQARAIDMDRRTAGARSAQAQIVAVTTGEIGPGGPLKKYYAIGLETPSLAMEAIGSKLKAGETAKWLDVRSLSVAEGEIRLI